jgi:HEPN domain-containing protein
VVYFHLHQSAEKLIKAVLSKNKVNFPKIHDLESLLNLLKDRNIDFNTNSDLLTELNDYAVEGRYSLFHDDVENVIKYFELLHNMIHLTNRLLFE